MALKIYKQGQGKYTRGATFAASVILGGLVAEFIWEQLKGSDLFTFKISGSPIGFYLVYIIPLVFFAGIVVLMYKVVNRPRSADFLIATEGEMKKVSWSSKQELIGATKVVIITTLLLAAMLGAVDLAFAFFFKEIGVLQVATGR